MGDTAVVPKTSMKFKNASEPSPATSEKYKAEQGEGKPFGRKGSPEIREYRYDYG